MRLSSSVPRYTAFDYTLIAINPVLIVLMVSALLHFLAYVFYQGEFQTRLTWILFFFTMGAVGVSRIVIEQGRSHAAAYALPLAVVTWLAITKFVVFTGPGALFNGLISALFIAVAWFTSYKLTWDCTVLEDERTGDGRGLLETAGLESGRQGGEQGAERPIQQPEDQHPEDAPQSAKNNHMAGVTDEWDIYSEEDEPQEGRSRKPHPHGVWVIYFSLVALPLFGLGQGSLADSAARANALALFCRYLACAMGLLATTSLLGIRRYLRRRNLRMPAEMTVIWLTTGAAIVGGVMFVGLLLPRPSPEIGIAKLLPVASAPKNLQPNRWGMFEGIQSKDRPPQPDGRPSPGNQQGQSQSRSAPHSAQRGQMPDQNPSSGSSDSGGRSHESAGSNQPMPSGNSKQANPLNGSERSKPLSRSGPSEKSSGEAKSTQPQATRTGESRPGTSQDVTRQNPGSDSHDTSQAAQHREDGRLEPTPSASDGSRNQEPRASSPEQAGAPDSAHEGSRASPHARRVGATKHDKDGDTGGEHSSMPAESANGAHRRQNATRWDLTRFHLPLSAHIGSVSRWLYWVVLLGAATYILWRYRGYVRQYLQHLRRQWQSVLEWWFGRTKRQDASNDSAERAQPRLTFSQLANPFSAPLSSLTLAELVRQSFFALEVWAADMGVPRSPDDTPLEFSAVVAARFPELSETVPRLGQWYCRLAYGDRRIPREAAAELRDMWAVMSRVYRTRRDS